jgi:IclR family transcriptional regulator, KDG regulon repressor
VVYVDRLESSQTLRLFTETGRRVPLHCTSSGKVLLAHLDDDQLAGLLAGMPMPALTPHTITDLEAMRAELARVRRRGWAEAVNEREIGVASVAAAIRDVDQNVVAAISIGAPTIRLGPSRRRELAAVVVEAAEAVSRRLGYSPETVRPDSRTDSRPVERGTSWR